MTVANCTFFSGQILSGNNHPLFYIKHKCTLYIKPSSSCHTQQCSKNVEINSAIKIYVWVVARLLITSKAEINVFLEFIFQFAGLFGGRSNGKIFQKNFNFSLLGQANINCTFFTPTIYITYVPTNIWWIRYMFIGFRPIKSMISFETPVVSIFCDQDVSQTNHS